MPRRAKRALHAKTARVIFLEPDFEDVCDLPKESSKKVDRALQMFSSIAPDEIPSPLQEIIDHVMVLNRDPRE